LLSRLSEFIPDGTALEEGAWRKRHTLLLWLLLVHVPGLLIFALAMGRSAGYAAYAVIPPLLCVIAGRLVNQRRVASFFVTVGLTYCSAALVGLSRGSIEAHFHFFIIIGFIALYQDWVPFLWNIGFTVISHGLGSVLRANLIFNHPSAQTNPWLWSAIHGVSVLAACGGVVIFWKTNEEEQQKAIALTEQLAKVEIDHRRFTSDMLVNLARRNQSLLYRQLELINQLEEQQKDPDALSDLFQLDHLATRIRRNAESLLVLSGEQVPRTWSRPVPLVDVVRAAIAETEDLDRVQFSVDERLAVSGHAVADLTHLLAELVENAVRFSPPHTTVSIRARPHVDPARGHVVILEDWGVGLPADELDAVDRLLASPQEVDLSVSQRLGLHVVARLAQRHGVRVSLSPTPGGGTTAVIVLPPSLFTDEPAERAEPVDEQSLTMTRPAAAAAGLNGWPPEPLGVWEDQDAASAPAWRTIRLEPPAEDEQGPAQPAAAVPRYADSTQPAMPAARPDPLPAARFADTPWPVAEPASVGTGNGSLAQRVPQSHLVPELRTLETPAQAGQVPAPDAAQARAALSRYHAARAQAQHEGDWR
jgi:signal transduction histidine kinase